MRKNNLTRNVPVKNKRRINKSYTLDQNVVDALTNCAHKHNTTTSFLVEQILRDYLKDSEVK